MELIFEDKQKRIINGTEEFKFSGPASFYLILLTIRVKNKKQDPQLVDNESASVQIDNKLYTKPVIFLGNRLKNLSQAIYFLLFLDGQEHRVILTVNKKQPTAGFENLEVSRLDLEEKWDLTVNNQAEDGDRRPWLTFVLGNLPLLSFTPTVTYARRKRDSDDVKIIFDGQTQFNLLKTIKHFLWRFAGSFLPIASPVKTDSELFLVNFLKGRHIIEFEADRMPILNSMTFDFGMKPQPQKRIPMVDDPKWTGDLNDDTEQVLLARMIFGEAESQPKEAKSGVGFTVLNRLKKQNPNWGLSVKEIILKENQYDGLWNPKRSKLARDPLTGTDEATQKAWKESYEVAVNILNKTISDPTQGATHFHSYREEEKESFPSWATERNFKVKIGNVSFYELEK